MADNVAALEKNSYRRIGWLLLLHVPALMCAAAGAWWWALLCWVVPHLVILWGTFNPQSALFGPVIRQLPGSDRSIWLTIDDGPSNDTLAMLQVLQRFDAKATFFLVAQRAEAHPEWVQAIVAAGHEIGNHSATHPAAWFWCLPPRRMRQEIVTAQQTLTALSGMRVRWFRAVVGHANPFIEPVLRALNLQRVAWSARAYDAVDGRIDRVVSKILRAVQPGAVVLLHEGAAHGNSVAILNKLLACIQERGYQARLPA